MLARPMTYKEIKHALELSENVVHSLKCNLTKHREKYRATKKECHKLRNERNTFKAELDRALFEIHQLKEQHKNTLESSSPLEH